MFANAFLAIKDILLLEKKSIPQDILHGISLLDILLYGHMQIHAKSYMHELAQEDVSNYQKKSIFFKEIKSFFKNEQFTHPVLMQAWCDFSNLSINIYHDFQKKNLIAAYKPIHKNIRLEISMAFIDGTYWCLLPQKHTPSKEGMDTQNFSHLYQKKRDEIWRQTCRKKLVLEISQLKKISPLRLREKIF